MGYRGTHSRGLLTAPQSLLEMQPMEWASLERLVMPGLVPGITLYGGSREMDVIAGTDPAMTKKR
jgi:hypothetical protein